MATAAEVFRDYITDGVPASGAKKPKKSEIRQLLGGYELRLSNAGGLGDAVWKATKALLAADLAHAAGDLGVVYEDTTSANNGLYVKAGGSGSGSWLQITTFLPGYQFVTATDDGGSTANAYTMDTSPRLPFGDGVALVEFVVPATNTSTTVTVSFDGDAPLTIKTASGNSPAAGGLIEGMPVSGVKIGSNFFMRSDQANAALVAQVEELVDEAEGFRDEAAAYADFARNNWAIAARFTGTGEEEDYLLSVDPGSENNMWVTVGGVDQVPGGDEPPWLLVYNAGDAFIRINVPPGVNGAVRVSNAIDVATPSDGSVTEPKIATAAVTTPKLADDAVTFEKMQNIATLRFLGRAAAGSGDVQELTATDLLDFLPSGSVIGGGSATISDKTATYIHTDLIPTDNTVPQATEGKAVPGWSITITPKSATSKVRVRFAVEVYADAASGVPAGGCYAIFSSASPNALKPGRFRMNNTGPTLVVAEHTFTPGSTSPITISVRMGWASGAGAGQIFRLAHDTTSSFGGAENGTFTVEEIKA